MKLVNLVKLVNLGIRMKLVNIVIVAIILIITIILIVASACCLLCPESIPSEKANLLWRMRMKRISCGA